MLSFCSGKSLPDLQPGGCYPVLQATLSIDPNCLLLSLGRVLVKGSGHLPAGQESLGSRFLCVPNPHPQYLRGRGELNRLTLPSADISNHISSGAQHFSSSPREIQKQEDKLPPFLLTPCLFISFSLFLSASLLSLQRNEVCLIRSWFLLLISLFPMSNVIPVGCVRR